VTVFTQKLIPAGGLQEDALPAQTLPAGQKITFTDWTDGGKLESTMGQPVGFGQLLGENVQAPRLS